MSNLQTSDNTRRVIVSAAAALFLARGYDNTTMQDLAEALNISGKEIRRYFASKTKLLIAVVAQLADDCGRRWETECEEGDGNAIAKLRRLLPRHPKPVRLTALECLQNGNVKLVTWLVTALAERLSPVLTGLIQQGCDEGLFSTAHPREAADFILVGLHFFTHQGIRPWSVDAYMTRAAAFPSVVESLLGAEAGSLGFLLPPWTDRGGAPLRGMIA